MTSPESPKFIGGELPSNASNVVQEPLLSPEILFTTGDGLTLTDFGANLQAIFARIAIMRRSEPSLKNIKNEVRLEISQMCEATGIKLENLGALGAEMSSLIKERDALIRKNNPLHVRVFR